MIQKFFVKNTAINQYLAILCANVLSVAYGTTAGWTSSSVLLLSSDETSPFENGALSDEQLSWISSLICFGGVIGTIVFGWLALYMGKKILLILVSLPEIVSWLLIIVAKSAVYLYASRFACGFAAGGVFVLIPLFVVEIAEDRVRGTLGSLLLLLANAGILIGFIVGNSFNFQQVAYVHICFPIIFLVLFMFFPETPIYYIKRNNMELAEKSLQFYRNVKDSSSEKSESIQKELESMKNSIESNKEKQNSNVLSLNDFKTKASRKSFFIGFSLISFHELCGVFVMLQYTATIFAQSGSSISPNFSAIIAGLIQLLGTMFSTKLVDQAGRKFLYLLSLIGCGISLAVLGTYSFMNTLGYNVQSYSWISIVSFSALLFLASCGALSLPYVVISEILPEKIRSVGLTICMIYSWGLSFALLKCFSSMVILVGMHGSIYFFSVFCWIGTGFVIYFMPETKGKSYDEILRILES